MGISAALGSSALLPAGLGFRNKLMNGTMQVNQRVFASSSSSPSTPANYDYTVDRWQYRASQASKFDAYQATTSTSITPPSNYVNALAFVSKSAYTVGSGEQFGVRQFIEGVNIGDLGWGTSAAKPIVLSFWARSSLTGTHSGVVGNSGDARAYPFSFTINTANTWEYKTVYINGDTSGTWLTTTGIGIKVSFNLGSGSTMLGTANAWTSGEIVGVTGSVSVVGTSGATFAVTGVQLEQNYQPTPFEQRPYGVELQLCQRYYQRWNGTSTYSRFASGTAETASYINLLLPPYVPMRSMVPADQTLSYTTIGTTGNRLYLSDGVAPVNLTGLAISNIGSERFIGINGSTSGGMTVYRFYYLEETSTGNEWVAVACEL